MGNPGSGLRRLHTLRDTVMDVLFSKRLGFRSWVGFLLVIGLVVGVDAPLSGKEDESLKGEIQRAKEQVYPALVNFSLVKRYFRSGKMTKKQNIGSGVVISGDGYAVTNFHVVDRASKIEGTLSNNLTLEASIVGKDPLTDLAVVKFDPEDLPDGMTEFPHASLGNSGQVEVGDYVLAMGSPLMMAQSVTLGIVSNDRRVFFSEEGNNRLQFGKNLQTGLFTEWIQHDASISPGSSGGPLVDLKGTVVGINARGATAGGDMGFSIPADQVRRIVDGLIENGRISRSWIGIGARPVKDTRYETGVVVGSVMTGSPADQAGIEPGDRLMAVDGEPVDVQFTEQLAAFYRHAANLPVRTTAVLTLQRNGSTRRISVRTKPLQNRRARKTSLKRWGINVQELTDFQRRSDAGVDTGAAMVASIRSGGPAENARPSLRSGDIIESINGDPIRQYERFLSRYFELTDDDTNPQDVLLGMNRQGAQLYSVLQPEALQSIRKQPRSLGNAWIGVQTQVLTSELRRKLDLEAERGVRVTNIYPNTRADASQLQVGDVITKIDDRKVKARHSYQQDLFATMVETMSIGKRVDLRVHRPDRSEPVTVNVKLASAPLRSGEVTSYRENTFDLTVREMTFYDRVQWNWPEGTDGVIVKSLETGGWAGVAGLQANDLVTRVDGTTVTTVREFRDALRGIIREKTDKFTLTVRRKNERRKLFVEPDWYENS